RALHSSPTRRSSDLPIRQEPRNRNRPMLPIVPDPHQALYFFADAAAFKVRMTEPAFVQYRGIESAALRFRIDRPAGKIQRHIFCVYICAGSVFTSQIFPCFFLRLISEKRQQLNKSSALVLIAARIAPVTGTRSRYRIVA